MKLIDSIVGYFNEDTNTFVRTCVKVYTVRMASNGRIFKYTDIRDAMDMETRDAAFIRPETLTVLPQGYFNSILL